MSGPDGKPAIPHNSKVKIKLQHPSGWFVDALPAFIRRATVPPDVFRARYDGVHWDPPPEERYQWYD